MWEILGLNRIELVPNVLQRREIKGGRVAFSLACSVQKNFFSDMKGISIFYDGLHVSKNNLEHAPPSPKKISPGERR